MPKSRVPLSGLESSISAIAVHYYEIEQSLREYHASTSPSFELRFLGAKPSEVRDALTFRLAEADTQATMALLAAVEAAFPIDFIRRCHDRKKNALSRKFRTSYQRYGSRIKLEDDIFEGWKEIGGIAPAVISSLKHLFHYRNWLAHGKYWTPKFGKTYDFLLVYEISETAFKHLGLSEFE